ncbi:MAG: 50S ribosomal protein L4 [Eubacteriales bacterium]
MPNMKVLNMAGNEVGEITLSDKVFGAEVNNAVLHTVVRAYLLNQRQGTQSTLTRGEVSGGGKKPWKQKGTGRARQGSTRSPQWTHGGIALGPKPRSYRITLNKKLKKAAMFSALSAKVADGDMVVIDEIRADAFKTKAMIAMLQAVNAGKKALVILPQVDPMVIKSCDNIPGVKTTVCNAVSVYDILHCNTLIADKSAVEKIEEVYAE